MRKRFFLALSCFLIVSAAAGAPQSTQKAPGTSLSPAQQAEAARISEAAKSALQSGDYAAAIQGFARLIQMAPAVAELHANLGVAYYWAGRPGDAVAPCRKALELNPRLTSARYFLGLSLAEAGACQEALPYLKSDYARVADLQLKRLMGTDAVRCAMTRDQPFQAVEYLGWLERDFQNDPDVLYLSTHVFSDLSTRASQRLLYTAPGSYQAHQLNAEALEIQGRLTDALAEYRKVLTMAPHLAGIHYRIGCLLLANERGPGALDAARKEFEEELEISRTDAGSEYELGEMDREARKWDSAIVHFGRAVSSEPDFVSALIGLGKSLVSGNRAGEAVAPLGKAVKLAPGDPVAHYQLSFAYRRVGREAEAQKELARYRELHEEQQRTSLAIRTAILGDISSPQTAEPPE
jgi:tetratricopeptide (TPR) repeat protein